MLGSSTHAWKVNFCKFTNETRNSMEDSSRSTGLKFLAALNGTCAGGGYEVALACDEIVMVDDRSTTVSLPEVPLLGVLPGTGGLTRLIDKRKVRRDLADVFCTTAEGVRADRAKQWKLVDHTAPPARFAELVRERARALAADSSRAQAGERRDAAAARAQARRAGLSLPLGRCRFRPRAAGGDAHHPRARHGAARSRRDRGGGRGVVAARHGARARRRHPDAARQRARAWDGAAEDPRLGGRRAGERRGHGPA